MKKSEVMWRSGALNTSSSVFPINKVTTPGKYITKKISRREIENQLKGQTRINIKYLTVKCVFLIRNKQLLAAYI